MRSSAALGMFLTRLVKEVRARPLVLLKVFDLFCYAFKVSSSKLLLFICLHTVFCCCVMFAPSTARVYSLERTFCLSRPN